MADNVLGALFGDIADAIRAKTGDTATMKPNEFPTKISEITAGGGGGDGGSDGVVAQDTLPYQAIVFELDESLGLYMKRDFNLFTLVSGEWYKVNWYEKTYTCQAVDGVFEGKPCVAIGNPLHIGGEDNGMRFFICCISDSESQSLCVLADLELTQSNGIDVWVYQGNTRMVSSFPITTITPTYSSTYNAYTVSLSLGVNTYYDNGCYYFYVDGVAYPCVKVKYACKVGSASSTMTVLGNPTLITKTGYGTITFTDLTGTFEQPFAIQAANSGKTTVIFADGATRKFGLDYLDVP